MRILLIALLLGSAAAGLSACTSDRSSPAIKAMEAANSCGPGGTSDITQCSRRR